MSKLNILSHRFIGLLVVLSLLGSLLGALAVWADVDDVTIETPNTGTPAHVARGQTFEVTYDTTGDEVATVNFYLDGTKIGSETVTLGFNDRITTLTIPATGMADGTYDLEVEAVGTSTGNPTEDDVQTDAVIVDSVAPAVTIDPIDPFVNALNPVRGTASDAASDVNLVEVKIQRASDGEYWDDTLGTPAWAAPVAWNGADDTSSAAPFATWKYDVAPPNWLHGETYTVCARATDEPGNVSDGLDCETFTYDTNDISVDIAGPPTGPENSVPSLNGTASDSLSGVASVEVQVENVTGGRYWNGTIWTATGSWDDASYAAGAWTYTMPTLTSGRQYQVTAKATDNAGNTATHHGPHTFEYDDVEPTVDITTPDPDTEYYQTMDVFVGTADDDTQGFGANWGLDKVEVKLQRLSDNEWWDDTVPGWVVTETLLSATGTTAWTYDTTTTAPPVNFEDGLTYEVSAKATDKAGNDPGDSDQFTIDETAPAATIDPIAGEVGCSFVQISGEASDATSGVDEVYVKIDAGAWVLATWADPNWTLDVSSFGFADGVSYDVRAKAVDNVALETAPGDQPTDTFTYDACPTVAFTDPAKDDMLQDLDEITGTATETEAVVEVKVQIQKGLTSDYWNGSAWQGTEAWVNAADTNGDGTWDNWDYDTSGIAWPDEDYVLRAKAKDDFGQWGPVEEIDFFTIDATAPSATIYNIPDPSEPQEISGTASDSPSSGLFSVKVKIQRDSDGNWWDPTEAADGWLPTAPAWTAPTDGTLADWTFNKAVDLTDGGTNFAFVNGEVYTVTVKAMDNAGNETDEGDQDSKTFTYDTPDEPFANITLGAGWNLMSLPLIPNDTTIEVVLAELIAAGKVDWVSTFVWESGSLVEKRWDWPMITELTDMTAGPGYWVDMDSAGILLSDGMYQPPLPKQPQSYPVYSGWNMIGYHTTTEDRLLENNVPDVETYLGPALTDDLQAMYYYDNANGVYVIAVAATPMDVGLGYWMALSEDGTVYPRIER